MTKYTLVPKVGAQIPSQGSHQVVKNGTTDFPEQGFLPIRVQQQAYDVPFSHNSQT